MTVQFSVPNVPVMVTPIILCDQNGNPLTGTSIAGNVNLNQVNGASLSNTNPVFVDIVRQAGIANAMAGSDGQTAGNVHLDAMGVYNGVSVDRMRGNLDNVTLLASAAQTTTQTIDNIANYNARGVVICVDTTVNATACSNVVTIYGKDPVSGKSNLLLTGAAITGVSTAFYTIYPGATPATNLTVSLPLPRTYKVIITAGNSNSATYSVAASYIL